MMQNVEVHFCVSHRCTKTLVFTVSFKMSEQTGWYAYECPFFSSKLMLLGHWTRHRLAVLTSTTQLSSSYIISRLWCYINDTWFSCCLTQHGPSLRICAHTCLSCRVIERAYTHARAHIGAQTQPSSLKAKNLLFDRWMWEAVTETKRCWERWRELSGWTEIAS